MSEESRQQKSRPSYSGYEMPININPNGLDECGEETTRRVAFHPSFEPTNFVEPPSMGLSCALAIESPQITETPALKAPSVKNNGWMLHAVPTLPEYHPLERTAVFVPHESPAVVAIRISDVLRDRSIESYFDDEKAKVRCTTTEGVDFRIRLYRGRGRFSHGIIVEVQRRFGTSNVFHSDTMAVLDAAEGKVPGPPSLCNMPLVSDSEDDYEPCGTSSLKMVSKMLNHEGCDSYYLALQTLQSLTDASKMGASTARAVAKELLSSEHSDVGCKVLSLILDKKEEDEMFKLRSMAMVVISNSIQALSGDIHDVLAEQLRPVLLQELRNAEKNPRNAVQAARAIEFLLSKDQFPNEIHAALEIAQNVGAVRHLALQRQAKRCLDKIN
jgi:hypothetical protein